MVEISRKSASRSDRYSPATATNFTRNSPKRSTQMHKLTPELGKPRFKPELGGPSRQLTSSRSSCYLGNSSNRYSKKLPISFIAAKDWRLYIHFTNKVRTGTQKKPKNRVYRLLNSFLKLYQEYSYVCDTVLPPGGVCDGVTVVAAQRGGDGRHNSSLPPPLPLSIAGETDSGRDSRLSRTNKYPQSSSVTFNDRVTCSNYSSRTSDGNCLAYEPQDGALKRWIAHSLRRFRNRSTNVSRPYDKIRRYQHETIEIFSTEKMQSVISHRISFTGFDSVGRPKIKWIQVPIALELLIPKIQSKIQKIMVNCSFLYDPLEVAAELRHFNYNVEVCISHFQRTKKFRDVLEEFLPQKSQLKELENNPQIWKKFQMFLEKIGIENEVDSGGNNADLLDTNGANKSYPCTHPPIIGGGDLATKKRLTIHAGSNDKAYSVMHSKLIKVICTVEKLKLIRTEIRQMIVKTQVKYNKQIAEFSCRVTRIVESFRDFLMTDEQRGRVMHLLKQNDELKIKLKEEEKKRKTIYNMMQDQLGNVRVYCRCRALDKHQSVLDIKTNDTIMMQIGFCEEYKFDKVFEPFRTQAAIYEEFQPLVMSFIDGFNVCFITYGGEASGKTYTLLGATANSAVKESERHDGIMKRALREVLAEQASRRRDWEYRLSASIVEIYNDTFVDLLTGESGLHLPIDRGLERVQESLKSVPITCDADIEALIKVCKLKRKVGRTALNPHSSRSHLITMIHLTGRSKIHGETISSFLAMCDLAGFEDILKAETHNNQTLSKEAGYINKSLTAFNRVFTSLRRQDPNTVSYRDTKLTYLLKPFLTNQGKCVLIVTVRTDKSSISSTQSTLRFGRESRSVALGKAKRQANLDNVIF